MEDEPLIGPGELARALRVSRQHIRNLVKNDLIPYTAVGRCAVRFRLSAVLQALKSLRATTPDEH
ncbi:MAG: helix-turn-helix transcriptional regulator [Ilumatobacteraceae bacterium]